MQKMVCHVVEPPTDFFFLKTLSYPYTVPNTLELCIASLDQSLIAIEINEIDLLEVSSPN